ncbi:Protein of unknown function [Propionibacterium freudenreichii]|nr:Protein of unknown function [Propionibacterium freudenreichii]
MKARIANRIGSRRPMSANATVCQIPSFMPSEKAL